MITKAIKFFVGGLFIFSGLVKLNDPMGTAIKLEEYFAVFSADIAGFFQHFTPFALPLAVVFVVSEVILGVALLLNFRTKDTLKVLLALTLFFTFLTFYSAYFNKVTDCGCFGDALKLTPWQSFGKDVLLLVLLIFLLLRLKPLANRATLRSGGLTLLSAVLCLFLAFMALRHLPFIDFRAYKKGANLPELIKAQEPCTYRYILEKDGELHQFDTYPTAPEYTFKEMKITNPESCLPAISDYRLTDPEGNALTDYSLSGKRLFVVVSDTEKTETQGLKKLASLLPLLKEKQIVPLVISSDSKISGLLESLNLSVRYCFADATVLKTMVRANPGFLYLENGVVREKWHQNDLPKRF